MTTPQPYWFVSGPFKFDDGYSEYERKYSHARWDRLLTDAFEEVRKLATLKGGEYSGDDDRLANFRRNGEKIGLPMEVIWLIYASKHWDAITQYIKDGLAGHDRVRLESLQGRALDCIVYLLLFMAMLEERHDNKSRENINDL